VPFFSANIIQTQGMLKIVKIEFQFSVFFAGTNKKNLFSSRFSPYWNGTYGKVSNFFP
jgi:hypothetical protein